MPSATTTRRLLWAALTVVLVVASVPGILRLLRPAAAPQLPLLGTIPAFTLVERSGKRVSSSELSGRPWVASFIFTRCSNVCPAVSGAMAAVQGRLQSRPEWRTRLVSFSVDPSHDTPEVLTRYAKGFGAEPERWLFLTGDKESLYGLIKNGFRLSVAELAPGEAAPPDGDLITHSDRLVLVDGALQIRGYYHGREPEAVAQLLVDLERLEGGS